MHYKLSYPTWNSIEKIVIKILLKSVPLGENFSCKRCIFLFHLIEIK